MTNEPKIIGWKEYIALPSWGVEGILAKVDTGALTSALHVSNIEELSGNRIRFEVIVSLKDPSRNYFVEADILRETLIKPSTGNAQTRYVVETLLRVGEFEKMIQVSLTSRKNMYCRMLIGRRALENDFLVDSSKAYIYGKRKQKSLRKKKI